jgi:hypothetical protein
MGFTEAEAPWQIQRPATQVSLQPPISTASVQGDLETFKTRSHCNSSAIAAATTKDVETLKERSHCNSFLSQWTARTSEETPQTGSHCNLGVTACKIAISHETLNSGLTVLSCEAGKCQIKTSAAAHDMTTYKK